MGAVTLIRAQTQLLIRAGKRSSLFGYTIFFSVVVHFFRFYLLHTSKDFLKVITLHTILNTG